MHLLSRDGVPSPGGVWGVPAADIRPLSDARQRIFMARGVFAMRRVSTTAHHQLLLPGEETLLQTRLPTVRAWIIWKIGVRHAGSLLLLDLFLFNCDQAKRVTNLSFLRTNTHNISFRKVELISGVDGMILVNLSSS